MKVLALDTASASCSVALWRDGAVRARRHRAMARGHAEALMPMVEAVLAEDGARFDSLDLVAAAIGPGSFTGLRTGLAAARGLALALHLPTFGVSSLEAAAHAAHAALGPGSDRAILIALETKRADVYAQLFSAALAPLGAPRAATPARLVAELPEGPLAVAGDAAARLREVLAGRRPAPIFIEDGAAGDASIIAILAAERFRAAPDGAARETLRPLYLHPPQAVPESSGGRIQP